MVLLVVIKSPIADHQVNLLRGPKKRRRLMKSQLSASLYGWSHELAVRLIDSNSGFTGSKSDGQRSPNDTVFLRMDEIPYIHEDRPENCGEDGEHC